MWLVGRILSWLRPAPAETSISLGLKQYITKCKHKGLPPSRIELSRIDFERLVRELEDLRVIFIPADPTTDIRDGFQFHGCGIYQNGFLADNDWRITECHCSPEPKM